MSSHCYSVSFLSVYDNPRYDKADEKKKKVLRYLINRRRADRIACCLLEINLKQTNQTSLLNLLQ